MSWLLFAFGTALFESLKDVAAKRELARQDALSLTAGLWFFSLPFVLPVLLVIDIPPLDGLFWAAGAGSVLVNTAATLLYFTALERGEISLTVPMLAFTPLLLTVTSPLILGESVTPSGFVGVALIVVGSYALNLRTRRQGGLLAPFAALTASSGPRLMLMVAVLWSLGGNLDKVALLHATPMVVAVGMVAGLAVGTMLAALVRHGAAGLLRSVRPGALLLLGFLNAAMVLCHMTAISLALVPYVVAVKRSSIVMSVAFGGRLFREEGLKERLGGTVLMFIGVVLITLG